MDKETNLYKLQKEIYKSSKKTAKNLSKNLSKDIELEDLKKTRRYYNAITACSCGVAIPSLAESMVSSDPTFIFLGVSMGTIAIATSLYNNLNSNAFRRRKLIKEKKEFKKVMYNTFKPDDSFKLEKEKLKQLKVTKNKKYIKPRN